MEKELSRLEFEIRVALAEVEGRDRYALVMLTGDSREEYNEETRLMKIDIKKAKSWLSSCGIEVGR